jgi:dihydrolipoamide dehydrogenase
VADAELVVIGAGPGGYAAAFLAADLGMDVTLVDPNPNPGGVCLYRGCIPSKALLHVAKVIHESGQAPNWGVTFSKPTFDLDTMRAWKNSVVEKLTGGTGEMGKRRKVKYRQGKAHLTGPTDLYITAADGSTETISFGKAIIATGSYPAGLPGFPKSPRIWDSTRALDLPEVPQRLLVVGGGYIGLELGTVYAALGSKVTVVEVLDSLLPGVDPDLVRPLARRLQKEFEAIQLGTRVTEVREEKDAIRVTLETEGKKPAEAAFDAVLVSVGRRPMTKGLGLQHTKVQVDGHGFIHVDAQRRTAEPTLYAIGDVAGEPMLAHKATHEGRTAVEAIHGDAVAFEPAAIPAVIFTDPEIAWAGLTEAAAKERGRPVRVAKFPWAASGRASTLGRTDGVTKLVVDPETERILGMGVCGPGAGELIAEGVLAIEMAARVKDVELSIHPHPTLTESVMEAASVFFGTSPHYYAPKRKGKQG